MIDGKIKGATHTLSPPKDWDTETNGECRSLLVRVVSDGEDGVVYQSAWVPSEVELAKLNAGGVVVLHVWGGQPPVAVEVETADVALEATHEMLAPHHTEKTVADVIAEAADFVPEYCSWCGTANHDPDQKNCRNVSEARDCSWNTPWRK